MDVEKTDVDRKEVLEIVETGVPEVPSKTEVLVKDDKLVNGVCHILSTKNNTIITVTDLTGAITYAKVTAGSKVKSKKDEGSQYAAYLAGTDAGKRAIQHGINACSFKVRGRGGVKKKLPGQGLGAAMRSFSSVEGMHIGRISVVTPIPTDSTKRKGGNRGRRV